VAGCIVAWAGTAVAFYLAGLGFCTMATVIYSLQVPRITRGARGSAVHDILEGLRFIRQNSLISFLIAMTFFNSFFGLAYITLMPCSLWPSCTLAPKGQGLLMGMVRRRATHHAVVDIRQAEEAIKKGHGNEERNQRVLPDEPQTFQDVMDCAAPCSLVIRGT